MACCGGLEGAYVGCIQAHAIFGCYAIMMSLAHEFMSLNTHVHISMLLWKKHLIFLSDHVSIPFDVHIASHDLTFIIMLLAASLSYATLRQWQVAGSHNLLTTSPSILLTTIYCIVHFYVREKRA